MAQLIKARLEPSKFFLKKSLTLVKKNSLISNDVQEQIAAQLIAIDESMQASRDAISHFFHEQRQVEEQFASRILRREKKRLAVEVILLMVDFLENLTKEALAINAIAEKIAANITKVSVSADDSPQYILDVKSDMEKTLSLKIYVPKDKINYLQTTYQPLTEAIGSLFSEHSLDAAKLELAAENITFDIEIDSDDIDNVLRTASRALTTRSIDLGEHRA